MRPSCAGARFSLASKGRVITCANLRWYATNSSQKKSKKSSEGCIPPVLSKRNAAHTSRMGVWVMWENKIAEQGIQDSRAEGVLGSCEDFLSLCLILCRMTRVVFKEQWGIGRERGWGGVGWGVGGKKEAVTLVSGAQKKKQLSRRQSKEDKRKFVVVAAHVTFPVGKRMTARRNKGRKIPDRWGSRADGKEGRIESLYARVDAEGSSFIWVLVAGSSSVGAAPELRPFSTTSTTPTTMAMKPITPKAMPTFCSVVRPSDE